MTLIAEGLTAERGGRRALAAPDFAVRRGEAAIVTGPNGAGKSTLLRVLAGLLRPATGRAAFEGAEEYGERVAYAGHLDAAKPQLSVRENLAFWARLDGGGGIDAALERFGLSALADEPAGWLSAGRRRRLALARLLVTKRPLWLLDEPTASLDADSAAVLEAIVADHCAGGGVAVLVSHVPVAAPEGPRIALSPPAGREAAGADPFLAGAWA